MSRRDARATRLAAPFVAAMATIAALAFGPCSESREAAAWPPRFEDVRGAWRASDVRLLDRNGAVLSERRVDPAVRRLAWTPLAEVSPALVRAVLLSEDARFREHAGFDALAFAASLRDALLHGRRRGASTITMQLASLLRPDLTPARGGRSLAQKLRQIAAARAIEARWSKDEILEAYLNRASFRGELQGVAAATQGIFGKAPHGVGDDEALVLAALLRAPNAAPARVAERAGALAARSGAEPGLAAARATQALARPPAVAHAADLAPHLAARLLPPGAGGDVATTLDAGAQRLAAAAIRDQLVALSGRNVRDAAALVVDNATGGVLAWVGSSGDLSSSPHVDGVRARRQAGSTLKPFLYALAFDDRLLTPASHLDDSPLDVSTPGGVYRPENYDRLFRGLVTARVALASSLNVPAVRTVQQVGVDRFVERLAALGFDELRRPDVYGESVALGSADVTLAELVMAYRALARGGVAGPLRAVPGEPQRDGARVFSPAASFVVASILADRSARSVTFGLESPLATPGWTAVKTGTSKDMRDNWCIGFSSEVTAGVWVGNFSGEPMWQVSGVDGAAPAWLEIMDGLERERPGRTPQTPDGVVWHDGGWILAGTEPAGAAAPPAPRPRRIRAPSDGTIVALDPDIPKERQRVFFESDPYDARLRWRLDGALLGAAGDLALWEPLRGRHRLELVDAAGAAVDRIGFEVR